MAAAVCASDGGLPSAVRLLPDETTPSVHLNREYQAFRREPMPYGWFRLRSILNALDTRRSAELAMFIERLSDAPERAFAAELHQVKKSTLWKCRAECGRATQAES